jgi:hypothetical protein
MFTRIRQRFLSAARRFINATCVVLGGGLLLIAVIGIVTPLLLGLALLSVAARNAAAQQADAQPMVFAG